MPKTHSMKTHHSSPRRGWTALGLALALTSWASAQQQTLVDWGQSWKFFHPMGVFAPGDVAPTANPASTAFNDTWMLAEADFATRHQSGPAPFGGVGPGGTVRATGTPATFTTYDSGTGVGPLGYGVIDYIAPGAEFTTLNATLTLPTNVNRRSAYFRTTFTVPPGGLAKPVLRVLMDDGAFIFLDGVLVATAHIAAPYSRLYGAFAIDATNTEAAAGLRNIDLKVSGLQNGALTDFVHNTVNFLAEGTHTLAVQTMNNAIGSSDLCMALQLKAEPGCAINTVVSNIVRDPKVVTPIEERDPEDDTISFDVTVNGLNGGPGGWTCDRPIDKLSGLTTSSGAYGTTVHFVNYPLALAQTAPVITFTDTADTSCTSTVTVQPPRSTITAVVSNIQRQNGISPTDPTDDTFSFDVVVDGTFLSPIWGAGSFVAATPPATGLVWVSQRDTIDYGTTYSWTGIPIAEAPKSITFHDGYYGPAIAAGSFNPTATVVVTPPRLMGTNLIVGGPAILAQNIPTAAAWTHSEVDKKTTVNNGNALLTNTLRTAPIALTGSGIKRIKAQVTYRDTSTGSNAESDDYFRCELILQPSGEVIVLSDAFDKNFNNQVNGFSGVADAAAVPPVSALENYDANRAKDELNPTGLAGADATLVAPFNMAYDIPGSATSAQLVFYITCNSGTEFFDVNGIELSAPADADMDDDGLSDAWETTFYAGSTAGLPTADTDADGQTDLDEYRQGTNPLNPGSRLTVGDVTVAAGVGNFSFNSVVGRSYLIKASANLQSPSWLSAALPVPATGPMTNIMLPLGTPAPQRIFVRVEATAPAL
jgi:hypothetical protein